MVWMGEVGPWGSQESSVPSGDSGESCVRDSVVLVVLMCVLSICGDWVEQAEQERAARQSKQGTIPPQQAEETTGDKDSQGIIEPMTKNPVSVQETVQESVQDVVQETVQESVQEGVQETVEESVQEVVQETVQESVQKGVQETVDESVQEVVQETVEGSVQEVAQGDDQEAPVTSDAEAQQDSDLEEGEVRE